MQVKILELRDRATFIPLFCVDLNPSHHDQRYLMRRCGYPCDGEPNIAITKLSADGDKFANDPYFWNDRTFRVAHAYILQNWILLSDGEVIDVEHILGEAKEPKVSERFSVPL